MVIGRDEGSEEEEEEVGKFFVLQVEKVEDGKGFFVLRVDKMEDGRWREFPNTHCIKRV